MLEPGEYLNDLIKIAKIIEKGWASIPLDENGEPTKSYLQYLSYLFNPEIASIVKHLKVFPNLISIIKFSKKTGKEVLVEIILFLVIIVTVVLLWQNNILLFTVLLIECGITIKLWKKKHDIMYFLVGATLGPLLEIIFIRYGIWAYTHPTLLGIPMWLPLLWGFAAIVLSRIARTIRNISSYS